MPRRETIGLDVRKREDRGEQGGQWCGSACRRIVAHNNRVRIACRRNEDNARIKSSRDSCMRLRSIGSFRWAKSTISIGPSLRHCDEILGGQELQHVAVIYLVPVRQQEAEKGQSAEREGNQNRSSRNEALVSEIDNRENPAPNGTI